MDFGREALKLRFELCHGIFWVDFPPVFQAKRPEKKIHQKNPPQNSSRTLFGKIPLGFLQNRVRKKGSLEKGSSQKSPFSRDSREFRDSRDFREPPDSGK